MFANSTILNYISVANMGLTGDGSLLVAGAPGVPSSMDSTKGAIYIKRKVSGSWTEVKKITEPAPGSVIGNAVAISNDGLMLAYIRENSRDGTTFTYDLVFMRNTGNDVWVVDTVINSVDIGSTVSSHLIFQFSKDRNSFFLSYVINNKILTYNYNSGNGWVSSNSIIITGNSVYAPSGAVRNHIAISADGLKVALIALTSNDGINYSGPPYFLYFTRSNLTSVWVMSYSYRFTGDITDSNTLGHALWGNDDLTVLALRDLYKQSILIGEVTVYKFNGNNLTKSCTISNPQNAPYDNFGFGFSISGDGGSMAVSLVSMGPSGKNQLKKGVVYVYSYNYTTDSVSLETSLVGGDSVIGDYFGSNIALSNDATTLAVSGYIGSVSSNRGAVYIFN